jgi:hypothetical protein
LNPRVAIDDFTVTGNPNNGLRERVPRHASCFRARSRTRSASKSANAFNRGFSRSICAICASANSTTEISPERKSSSCRTADSSTKPFMIAPLQTCHPKQFDSLLQVTAAMSCR